MPDKPFWAPSRNSPPPLRRSRRRNYDSSSPPRRGPEEAWSFAWIQLVGLVHLIICLVVAFMGTITTSLSRNNPPLRRSRRGSYGSSSPTGRQERVRHRSGGFLDWRQSVGVLHMGICFMIALMGIITTSFRLGNTLGASHFLCNCSGPVSCHITRNDSYIGAVHLLFLMIMMNGMHLISCIVIIVLLNLASLRWINLENIYTSKAGCVLLMLTLMQLACIVSILINRYDS